MNIQITSSAHVLEQPRPKEKLAIRVHPGEKFEIVDVRTGKTPLNLVARHVGDSLIIEVGAEDVSIELLGFFSEAVVQTPASIAFSSPSTLLVTGADGLTLAEVNALTTTTTITSSGNALQPLAGNQIGSLSSDQIFSFSEMGPVVTTTSEEYFSAAVTPLGGLVGAGSIAGLSLGAGGASAAGAFVAGGAAATSTANVVVSGTIVAGQAVAVMNISLYDTEGNVLAAGTTDAQGGFRLNIANGYTGAVLAVVSDANGNAPDYLDEASGRGVSLGAIELRAASVISGDVAITISPLTELAVRLMGVTSNQAVAPADVDAIHFANRGVASALGLGGIDISAQAPIATNSGNYNPVNGLSNGERYGAVLAALSGVDTNTGGMEQSLNALSFGQGMSLSGGQLSLNPFGFGTFMAGANAAAARVNGDLTQALTAVAQDPDPTVAISGSFGSYAGRLPAAGDVMYLTFGFSESIRNFDASDIVVTGGTISRFVMNSDAQHASAHLLIDGSSSSATVSVASGAFTDLAGHVNTQENEYRFIWGSPAQNGAPTVRMSGLVEPGHGPLAPGDVIRLNFDFSEPIQRVDAGKIMAVGSALKHFVMDSSTHATADLFLSDSKRATVIVPAGTFVDADGQANAQNAAMRFEYAAQLTTLSDYLEKNTVLNVVL